MNEFDIKAFLGSINKPVSFFNVSHLYTHTSNNPLNSVAYTGLKPDFSLYLAKQDRKFPAVLICDRDGIINNKTTDLALTPPVDNAELEPFFHDLPPSVIRKLYTTIEEHGISVKDADIDTIIGIYQREALALLPIHSLRGAERLREVDWEEFISNLVSWKCDKDPRLKLVHSSSIFRGVVQRLNPHSLVVTNPGTGKTTFFKMCGIHIGKATKNSFLGFAKSPAEIYPGVVDGSELPTSIDQIESNSWSLLDFMFDIMESGSDNVSSGGVSFRVDSTSLFSLQANPVGEGIDVERTFGNLLNHIAYNPAIGRRFGLVLYGRDYTRINPPSLDELDNWGEAVTVFRVVEEYSKPQLKKILTSSEVWKWLKEEIPQYSERVKKVTSPIREASVRQFLEAHGEGAQHRVKAASLLRVIAFNLNKIALNEYHLEDLIDEAKEGLIEYVELNLESIKNIATNLEKETDYYAIQYLENAPEYIKEIVYAIEVTRRSGIVGNSFQLTEIDYKPRLYDHISKAIDRLLKRKRGKNEINNTFRRFYGFEFNETDRHLPITLLVKTPYSFIQIPDPKSSPSPNSPPSPYSPILQTFETEIKIENSPTQNTGETENPEKTEKPENPFLKLTLQEKYVKILDIFVECHRVASPDYIASRLGIDVEDMEKLLKGLGGKVVFQVPGESVWRFTG